MNLAARVAGRSIAGLAVFGALVFGPAGTFDYWRGWVFIAVFTAATLIPTGYLAVRKPEALRRRLRAGPAAETRPLQKAVIAIAFLSMAGMIALSALDFRFGWSHVPAPISIGGDALVAAGLLIAMSVVAQNSYAASTVTVEAGQQLSSTGWYALVRHPMYLGDIVMMLGAPPALGSYWGLLFLLPGIAMLVLRIRDEEALLTAELPGYRDYTRQVRYRLVPWLW
ncbi:ergosterol biosynthesis ERG4/ERG24 family protein [Mycolicibacterium hassiacum DSM 44199]|jgi:protein-S-isoprenylcysteine O-methyltransferase Ste14|uniref:Ergosterol biosynthesis ERG4/ERG24 family protein n=1 Tax=Mycolicibacterium hassiacum (strain DSM 44199 / CIP 105218 / JCM 12690 / 3849) TaxID=1122247 RepID=K5BJA9_MYCHD|nr:isoprenylcysteine carboxylmethyltransferase family protein [Mycolicibacterium hassiacum]EKF22794.1 ergosterol biosynthesis ERG4/ERG24 family protein [Mycolicibacterium hassiacum DSM 44199]MBX5487505.1 isoprenylcysteine carboxylmethyltransferase family protein [Mycolicibacterium hassiacum]MDA4084113.1 membrane protein [Mycolicibacterium hassiacum DSM 44199]VCT91123.1 hypothetical protein MHAS_02837 [Mycolicibacterium hassiacum DSM 44199]